MKKFFASVRIEEYLLIFFCLCLFSVAFIIGKVNGLGFNPQLYFKQETENLLGVQLFFYPLLFFAFIIILFKIISRISIIPRAAGPAIKKFRGRKLLAKLKISLFILRSFLPIVIFFVFFGSTMGLLNNFLNSRVINNQLIELDKKLFDGYYPFIWFQSQGNIFKFFDIFICNSFGVIALGLCIPIIIFYFSKRREFFAKYVTAIIVAIMLSLPLWIIFPSNSPYNAFVSRMNSEKKLSDLNNELRQYNPTDLTKQYQENIGNTQKNHPPITTFPSMHIAFSLIITYYIWKFNKKLSFIFMIWTIFSGIGTVYLAQHYFIDIIMALPITVLAIDIANKLVPLEKKYYRSNGLDKQEAEIKSTVLADISYFFSPFVLAYGYAKKAARNVKLL